MNPSPTACAQTFVRGVSDGETGADAPNITDPELCRVYVEARGLGTLRSGRDTTSQRAPLFASAWCLSILEPAHGLGVAACVGDEAVAPSEVAA